MKRTPLKRKTPLKRGTKGLKRTRLKPMSDAKKIEHGHYLIEKALYLRDHPYCECHDFVSGHRGLYIISRGMVHSRDVHHKKRRGKLLRAQEWWLACCRNCHDYIEANKKWARSVGLILYK